MNSIFRIIDANINRVSEGLRVLEDLGRFLDCNELITEEIKKLRHNVRKSINDLSVDLLSNRDTPNDIGFNISQKSNLDKKTNTKELVLGNFKRVQEGLRVIEENLKVAGFYEKSKLYEKYRYETYTLEKSFCSIVFMRKKLQETDIYCITAQKHSNGRNNIDVVKELLNANIKIIQYREKDKTLLEKYNECLIIRKLTEDYGADFIINDDLDIAILVNADGVHIGQDDLPINKVREIIGEKMLIGVSTHSSKQALEAVKNGADYIGVGPIFHTKTKKNVCDPVGLEYLQFAVKNIDIPFVTIGGIKEHNIEEVLKCGAKCIVLVTEIVGANNITQKIKDIRKIINLNKII